MTPPSGHLPRIPTSQRLRTARYSSRCVECRETIDPGEKLYMLKIQRWVFMCEGCGPFSLTWEEDQLR